MNRTLLANLLRAQTDECNPDSMIYPDARDDHPDHYTIGTIVQKILSEDPLYRITYAYTVYDHISYP